MVPRRLNPVIQERLGRAAAGRSPELKEVGVDPVQDREPLRHGRLEEAPVFLIECPDPVGGERGPDAQRSDQGRVVCSQKMTSPSRFATNVTPPSCDTTIATPVG